MEDEDEFESYYLLDLVSEVVSTSRRMSATYFLEEYSKKFRKMSGECYSSSRDAEAKFYRDLAEDFESRAKNERASTHAAAVVKNNKLYVELEKRVVELTKRTGEKV